MPESVLLEGAQERRSEFERTGIRILLVEDHQEFGDLAATFLERERESFTVRIESDPETALDALLGEDPEYDCVVSDYRLPSIDGLELLDLIREAHSDLPFILLTGKGSEEIASEAISAGVTDYLQKGGGTDQFAVLANRIDNAVSAYRTRHGLRRGERYRRALHRITSEQGVSSDRKIDRVLELGCEYLGVANAHITTIDTEVDHHEITRAVGSDLVEEGSVTDLSETFCRKTVMADDILGVANAPEQGWADDPAYQRWNIGCYMGGKIVVDGDLSGTVCFANRDPRDARFTHTERAFVESITRWLGHVFARRKHSQEFRIKDRAMDATPIGITITDPDRGHEIVYANERFTELTGYAEETVRGETYHLLQAAETDEQSLRAVRDALDNDDTATVDIRASRNDGETFWDRIRVVPLRPESGSVVYAAGFHEDVSDEYE